MPKGGYRPGAGRKPGAAAVKVREAADRLAKDGLTPLDYLVGILRGTHEFDPEKFEAAKYAAPYIHPRLAAIEHSGEVTTVYDVASAPISDDEWERTHVTEH